MNNKGFSLIELLVVIALIAVVLLIFTPNITKLVDEFRDDDKVEMLKRSAISAAKEYVVDGKLSTTVSCGFNYIDVSYLVNDKYLGVNDWYKDNHKINVFYDCDNKKFTEYKYCINITEAGVCEE